MPQNRNLDEIRRVQEQIDAAQLEYDREFAPLCRLLNITPAQLGGLSASVVVSLFDIRIFRILSLKLRELDNRIAQLEHASDLAEASPSTPRATQEQDLPS